MHVCLIILQADSGADLVAVLAIERAAAVLAAPQEMFDGVQRRFHRRHLQPLMEAAMSKSRDPWRQPWMMEAVIHSSRSRSA